LAVPEVYEFCEAEGLLYVFGFASNEVLKRSTDPAVSDLQTYYACYQHREPEVQRFEVIEDYQAEGWSRPRRIVAKIEINRHGVNRRFTVTNLSGQGQGIYHGVYVQRGDVPERPIGELKNGLQMDRLSFHRFRANGLKLLEHTLAYALVVLHREATATIPEIATASVMPPPAGGRGGRAMSAGTRRLVKLSVARFGAGDVTDAPHASTRTPFGV
jgi:hypothetical protein